MTTPSLSSFSDGPLRTMSSCPACFKPLELCICNFLRPQPCATRVLILQHPQEKKELLSTARLVELSLPSAVTRVGLSWRNLAHALNEKEKTDQELLNPRSWGVLYLGTQKKSAATISHSTDPNPIAVVSKNGAPIEGSATIIKSLKGIIVLDGNWRQAKTLWWRNPWLLKAHRLLVRPPQVSRYGSLRREPRKESVSSIEALAIALTALEANPEIGAALMTPFEELLSKYEKLK